MHTVTGDGYQVITEVTLHCAADWRCLQVSPVLVLLWDHRDYTNMSSSLERCPDFRAC